MNDKKAKALRRKARAATVGSEHTVYVKHRTGAVCVATHCTRGVYLWLKAAA